MARVVGVLLDITPLSFGKARAGGEIQIGIYREHVLSLAEPVLVPQNVPPSPAGHLVVCPKGRTIWGQIVERLASGRSIARGWFRLENPPSRIRIDPGGAGHGSTSPRAGRSGATSTTPDSLSAPWLFSGLLHSRIRR